MGTKFSAFWFGRPFNVFEWSCIRSFVRRGHRYRLFTYEPMDVPEGVELADAAQILPRERMFFIENAFTGHRDVGPFSDLFRYKLLMDQGGWYVDVDTICMTDADLPIVRAWAQEREGRINGAQMCLPKDDPLARILYEECVAVGTSSATREDWGPNLLTRVIPKLGLPLNEFGTTNTFYPLDWMGAFIVMLPQYYNVVTQLSTQALFVSIYQSLFQYAGLELSRTPPRGSYLREFYERHAPERITAQEYTIEEVIVTVRRFVTAYEWGVNRLVDAMGKDILDEIGITAGGTPRMRK